MREELKSEEMRKHTKTEVKRERKQKERPPGINPKKRSLFFILSRRDTESMRHAAPFLYGLSTYLII